MEAIFSSCFNNALFLCLFSFLYYNLGWCLCSSLGQHSLPLFNYEYLMFYVFQSVCKGKVCEAIVYSLQTSEFQSSKAYFWENLLISLNAKCIKKAAWILMLVVVYLTVFIRYFSLRPVVHATHLWKSKRSGFRKVTTGSVCVRACLCVWETKRVLWGVYSLRKAVSSGLGLCLFLCNITYSFWKK